MGFFNKVTIVSMEPEVPLFVTSMYNPEKLSFSKKANWDTSTAGKNSNFGIPSFKGGDPITLDLDLFFDRYEEGGDVRLEILKLMQFAQAHDKLTPGPRPPLVRVLWLSDEDGDALSLAKGAVKGTIDPLGIGKPFQGVVEDVTTTYTMFLSNGSPCRAEVKVKIRQADPIEDKTDAKVPKSSSDSNLKDSMNSDTSQAGRENTYNNNNDKLADI